MLGWSPSRCVAGYEAAVGAEGEQQKLEHDHPGRDGQHQARAPVPPPSESAREPGPQRAANDEREQRCQREDLGGPVNGRPSKTTVLTDGTASATASAKTTLDRPASTQRCTPERRRDESRLRFATGR